MDGSSLIDAEYLYIPCARIRCHGYPAQTRRWVQPVPIVRKTAKLIYYASDSWDRREAVVSPGCISREQFETDTRCHDRCRHGYPAGVIPVPGDRHRPGPAPRLFFATREAAEADLYRGERERAEQVAPKVPPIKELRRAMADAHPDRGGTAEQFIEARRQYQTALRYAEGNLLSCGPGLRSGSLRIFGPNGRTARIRAAPCPGGLTTCGRPEWFLRGHGRRTGISPPQAGRR